MAKRKPKNHYGEGSIFYSNVKQKWMAQINVGKDENGKVIRKSVTAETQEEVKAKLDELKLSIYTGKFVSANTITFSHLINEIICTVYCTLNYVMALPFLYEYAIIIYSLLMLKLKILGLIEMSNPIDKINTVQDINDRKEIINRFRLTGYIDRNDAINKIVSLRSKDSDILAVATAEQISGSVPLSDAPNEALINELQKQIDLLTLKLGD